MIRIDLSKENSEKTSSNLSLPPFVQALLTRLHFSSTATRAISDARTLILVGTSIAFSLVPHLFFGQYRAFVISQHAKQLAKLQTHIDSINAEINKLTPFEKELESYEQQKKMVSERLEAVQALLASRNTPVNILDAIAQALPAKTWLESLTYDFKPGVSQVAVGGLSYSNDEISDFVDRLSESIYLQEVKLNEVGTKSEKELALKSFQLLALPKEKYPAETVAVPAPASTGSIPAPGGPPKPYVPPKLKKTGGA